MKRGLRLALVVFLFVWLAVIAGKADASTCYYLYLDEDCYQWDYRLWDSFLVLLYDDGSFIDEYGDYGFIEIYGSSMHITYEAWSGSCWPFFAGTKKQGFYQCTDGSAMFYPGCWYLKKTKSSYCS